LIDNDENDDVKQKGKKVDNNIASKQDRIQIKFKSSHTKLRR